MKSFRNFKIKTKILAGYFCILLFFIILGVYYIKATIIISNQTRKIELCTFPEGELIGEIQRSLLFIKEFQNSIPNLKNQEELTAGKKYFNIYTGKINQLILELKELSKDNTDIYQRTLIINDLFKKYVDLINKEINKDNEKIVYWKLSRPAVLEALESELNDLRNENISLLSIELAKIDYLARSIRIKFIYVFLVTIVFSVFLAFLIAGAIIKPIQELVSGMKIFSKGNFDYSITIQTEDEIGSLQSGFLFMANNIRNLYNELLKEKEELEDKVKERTKDLMQNQLYLVKINEKLKTTQVQLVQSAKMAAIGLLTSGVAHEINNPLTGILNNIELLKIELEKNKNHKTQELKEFLRIINEEALRCKKIIQDLLEFSRAEKGASKSVIINEALEKIINLAVYEFKLENIKITRDFANDLPLLKIDINRFQQVILNIINNAKWSLGKKEGAEIKIKTLLSPDKKFIIIEISDNGIGIEKEYFDRLFEPFFTTKSPREGTGLGLSICYQIIKDFNGMMEAESEGKDKGATFRITLPVIKPAES